MITVSFRLCFSTIILCLLNSSSSYQWYCNQSVQLCLPCDGLQCPQNAQTAATEELCLARNNQCSYSKAAAAAQSELRALSPRRDSVVSTRKVFDCPLLLACLAQLSTYYDATSAAVSWHYRAQGLQKLGVEISNACAAYHKHLVCIQEVTNDLSSVLGCLSVPALKVVNLLGALCGPSVLPILTNNVFGRAFGVARSCALQYNQLFSAGTIGISVTDACKVGEFVKCSLSQERSFTDNGQLTSYLQSFCKDFDGPWKYPGARFAPATYSLSHPLIQAYPHTGSCSAAQRVTSNDCYKRHLNLIPKLVSVIDWLELYDKYCVHYEQFKNCINAAGTACVQDADMTEHIAALEMSCNKVTREYSIAVGVCIMKIKLNPKLLSACHKNPNPTFSVQSSICKFLSNVFQDNVCFLNTVADRCGHNGNILFDAFYRISSELGGAHGCGIPNHSARVSFGKINSGRSSDPVSHGLLTWMIKPSFRAKLGGFDNMTQFNWYCDSALGMCLPCLPGNCPAGNRLLQTEEHCFVDSQGCSGQELTGTAVKTGESGSSSAHVWYCDQSIGLCLPCQSSETCPLLAVPAETEDQCQQLNAACGVTWG